MSVNLLRVEAVNLDNSVLDTDDLSTRRGGSYMLLQAVRDVQNEFEKKEKKLKAVSTGASVGLFEVLDDNPSKVEADVRDYLHSHPHYRHATFVIDTVSDGAFKPANEQAIAFNRWRQMQSLSIAPAWGPPERDEGEPMARPTTAACYVDEVRPAQLFERFPDGERRSVSASVWVRRFSEAAGGRKLRQEFYERELKKEGESAPALPSFTDHLEQLSQLGKPRESDPSIRESDPSIPTNLNAKIAVFYADGNGFGGIQSTCESPDALRDWDEKLKTQRRKLLGGLIKAGMASSRWKTDDNKLRFETLLWGGDELMFVVPAWVGLELAKRFFDFKMEHRGNALTHAAALVFAHHNAPIGRLESLARSLVNVKVKKDREGENALAWMVLESFDHAGPDLDGFLKRRFPDSACRPDWKALILSDKQVESLHGNLPQLREQLPRSALTRALRTLASGPILTEELKVQLKRAYQSVLKADESGSFIKLWQALAARDLNPDTPSAADIAPLTTILELWDYAIGEDQP